MSRTHFTRRHFLGTTLGSSVTCLTKDLAANAQSSTSGTPIRLASFRADVTPPIGSPLCGGLVKPAAGVTDPLLALGIVILPTNEAPIVLCAIDWCEIRVSDHVRWRHLLAQAAGTTPERVALHSLHQHNAPLCDSIAHGILNKIDPPINVFDVTWADQAMTNVANSIKASLANTRPVSHISHGQARVGEVASNRRILGPDGKIARMRLSSTRDASLRQDPEGNIDPLLKTISFWDSNQKLASLHYYATHPMSFYGDGLVTHDFVGMARERRTKEEGVPHLYFTGCGGNIAAGKYNEGTPESRARLAENIYQAMVTADKQADTQKQPFKQVAWHWKPMHLKPDPAFSEERMLQVISNPKNASSLRISAALRLAFIRHSSANIPIPLASLHLGDNIKILHLPGESFIEYQLFAQEQSPNSFVATASYGDGGPGYIPLEKSFEEGGYEPTQAFAAPDSEKLMKSLIVDILSGRSS